MTMVTYLLKSSACMAIFLLFYLLVLERENMHNFKRFFLLAGLIASFVIPALVFTTYVETMTSPMNTVIVGGTPTTAIEQNLTVGDGDTFDWSLLFWAIYGLGSTIFAIRFLKHCMQLFQRIRTNPKRKLKAVTQVLLQEQLPPHTFFKYIFLNKEALKKGTISKEVLLHEEAHARQLHSFDVFFIELLQVFFWFNPLLIGFKRSIKLNHEFLADRAVLHQNIATTTYQNTLLSFVSATTKKENQSIRMANAINYSSTRLTLFGKTFAFGSTVGHFKKRFKVMGKHTSKTSAMVRSLMVLAVTTIMILGFSTTEKVVRPDTDAMLLASYTARSLQIKILGNNTYDIEGTIIKKPEFIDAVSKLHTDVPFEVRNDILNVHVSSTTTMSNEEVWFIYKVFLNHGFYRIVTPSQEIVRAKGNTPVAIEDNTLAKNDQPLKSETATHRGSNFKLEQTGASREQMKEYNALAKKYNDMPKDHMRIKMKEVEHLKYIYSIMSKKQREDAEPLPDFPTPPDPSKFRSPPEIQKVTPPAPPAPPNDDSDHDFASKKIDSIIENQDPDDGPVINIDAVSPPPPPTPISPLDHIIDLAKQGATFYYNGKEVSSDTAIALFKMNRNMSIETKTNTKDKPTVYISN